MSLPRLTRSSRPSRPWRPLDLLPLAPLLPFLALSLLGTIVLLGWWTERLEWVQWRANHLPFPANAALGFLLVGLIPLAALRFPRRVALAVPAALIAGGLLVLFETMLGADWGLANALVRHEGLIAGRAVGRVPPAFAALLVATAAALAWLQLPRPDRRRPLTLALLGSLAAAYGVSAGLAGRVGLDAVPGWPDAAHVSPLVALGLLLLGAALAVAAARDSRRRTAADESPRWLWLPVAVAGITVTLLFHLSLRQREVNFVNATTQLTINALAVAFKGETEAQINNLNRMRSRWNEAGGTPQVGWAKDAAGLAEDFPAYRSISWVGPRLRTAWIWPEKGNEESLAYDHASDPVRRQAMARASQSFTYAIAAPVTVPGKPACFAIYATVLTGGAFDGYILGEINYDELFSLIDQRLNLSRRYHVTIGLLPPAALGFGPGEVPLYNSAATAPTVDPRYVQTATFHLLEQRLTVRLVPQPEIVAPGRQSLPSLVLVSGLGVSALLGLVVNLAQTALTRQRRAEAASLLLRAENEERRRIETRLKETDERLNLALESTQVGVYEWDVPTGRTLYSPSVWTSLGYDPPQMPETAKVWVDLMHPDDVPAYRSAIEEHLRGTTPYLECEYRIRHANQEWHWFSARAKCVAHDSAGRALRVAGTCQDVTARKRSEEALRESQAATRILSYVARRTDNLVIITSPSGNIEWVNESFTRVTGYALPDVTGALFLDLLGSPDSDPRALERITASVVAGEPVTTEVMATATGEERHYHLRLELQPVKSDRGSLEHFIAIATDITSRVETERELRRAKTEADAASRAKSEFLASMSHEIRTPMNGVIGMTSLLLDTNLDQEQKDYVSTIRTSGDALLAIINEILDFSKIESGRMELENQPFELAQCLEEAIDIFALSAAAKNIELAYAIAPGVPAWISGDITRLRQVLVNLLNNAVKFTPQGQITVELRLNYAEHEDGTRIPCMAGEAFQLDFIVTDTGIGIPPERLHLLFKPFSQVDSSTTRKYGGTGLGLAICDRLCQLMGGTIDVSSTLGQGSRFRFSILAPAVPPPADLTLPVVPAWMHGGKLLVVDDLKLNRELLTHVFSAQGVTVLAASQLYDAAALVVAHRLCAAIIDVELIGETGTSLAEQLRRDQPRLPIILLTNPVEGTKRNDSQDPWLLRLPKPIKPAYLIECIRRQFKTVDTAPPLPPPIADVPDAPLGQQLPLRLLLVEDNPVNKKVALRFLENLGYRADTAGNGIEAVRALAERDYDLVFMDVQMPEMDGYAATREIRARYPAPRQPKICALTANAVQGDRERCLAAGMDDYISKPVKLENLRAVIEKYFRSPAPPPA